MKKKIVGVVIAWLFGWAGGYRFYQKEKMWGFIYLFTLGLFGIGWIFDIIYSIFSLFTDNIDSKKKKLLYLITVILFSLLFCNALFSEESDTVQDKQIVFETTTELKKDTENKKEKIEYDKLQQLYLDISPDMSYSDMKKAVVASKLPFSEEKYNGSREIQVAFSENMTAQKYLDETGDYLEIIYSYPKDENSSNDELNKYFFTATEYCPADSYFSLISYDKGIFWDYTEPGNYISYLGDKIDSDMSKKEQLEYYFEHKDDND